MDTKRTIMMALVAAGASGISALSHAEAPGWDLLGIAYRSEASSAVEAIDYNGFAIEGSKLVSERAFVAGSYWRGYDTVGIVDAEGDAEFEVDHLSLGAGYRYPVLSNTDLFAVLSYERRSAEVSSSVFTGSADGDAYALSVGVRSMVTNWLEFGGELERIIISGESSTGVNLSVRYVFDSGFAIGLSTEDGDVSATSINARYYF